MELVHEAVGFPSTRLRPPDKSERSRNGGCSTNSSQLGLMEETVVDMSDADQRHRRAVGQADRRIAVLHMGRRDDMVDRMVIFALETDPVALRHIEADDRVVAGRPAVLD